MRYAMLLSDLPVTRTTRPDPHNDTPSTPHSFLARMSRAYRQTMRGFAALIANRHKP